MPPRFRSSFSSSRLEEERLLLGHGVELAGGPHAAVLLHLADALADGLEVGEHAAQPALVDVRHPDLLGVALDRVLGLLLGADEEDGAAVGDQVADEGVGILDPGQRLLQVDDVDATPLAEDEALHLRVPAAGLVSEVDTCLEQLLHGDDGHDGLLPVGSLCRDPASGAGAGPGAPERRPRDGPGAWCVVDARPGGRQAGWRCYRAGQAPRTSARAATRKPPAPTQVLEEADPLPRALVEQGRPGRSGSRAGARLGPGRAPAWPAALPGRSLWALVPMSGTTTSSIPGARLRGTGTTRSPRAAIDTAWMVSGTGWSRQLGDQVGGLAQLRDRRRRRRRAPGRSRRRTASSTSPPVLGARPGVDARWPGRRRRAATRAWPACPTRSSQSLAVAALELDQGQPRDDPALRVGDQVDRHARGAGGDLLDAGRRAGSP